MSFFDTLQTQTAQERQALFAVPVIRDALAGKVSLDSYIAFLTQAYYHVRHTVPLMMACGARLPSRLEWLREREQAGERWVNDGLPMLCQVCQIPMAFTEMSDPTRIASRESTYHGMKYHFCSDGCKDVFDAEPEKLKQAWLPVHQIFQGNCGGATLPEVLDWYHLKPEDRGDYADSPDRANWQRWTGRDHAAGEPGARE